MLVPAAMYLIGRSPFGPPKMVTLALAAASVCLGFLLDARAREQLVELARRSPILWAAGAFLGVGILATLTAADRHQALLGGYPDYRGMLMILACAAIGAGGVVIARREESLLRFWRAAVATSVGILGFGVLQRLGAIPAGPSGYFKEGMRISTTLGNSSNYGVFLAILIPLLVYRVVAERDRWWRWAAVVCTGMAILGLLWALSRGAWLGGLAVLVVWPVMIAWAGRSRALVNRLGVALLLAVVLAAVGAGITPGFSNRASQLIDVESRTARWRLSAWRSSWQMTLDRPFLGYGPNTYRLIYPQYQESGQVGGGRGYRTIEAAHNVFFDTSTSFGFAGLLALGLLGGLVTRGGLRALARERSGLAMAPTALVALLGGFVSIQFHYITMDTGPLFAVLIGLLAAGEYRAVEVASSTAPAFSRTVAATGFLLFGVTALSGVGLMAADVAADRGAARGKADVPWSAAHQQFARAASLAPWEPQIRRAEGTAATGRMLEAYDAQAFRDGLAALDAVLAATPLDTGAAAERANLLLAAGVKAKDQALLQQAVVGFSSVIDRDPNTGIPRAGRAAALLALGRTDAAIVDFKAALERSPKDKTAWRNLAIAYEQVGRTDDANDANRHAQK